MQKLRLICDADFTTCHLNPWNVNQQRKKGSPPASGLTPACSVKSEGCCNQETLILFNVITKCLGDYPGLLRGKKQQRENTTKKKDVYIIHYPVCCRWHHVCRDWGEFQSSVFLLYLRRIQKWCGGYWLAGMQRGNGYINDKCLRASRDGRRTWQEDELRRWLQHQSVLVRRSGPPEPTQLYV